VQNLASGSSASTSPGAVREEAREPSTDVETAAPAARRLPKLPSTVTLPAWVAASRIFIGFVFAHLLIRLFPESLQTNLPGAVLNRGTWWGAFDRWDAQYYIRIAQHGYARSNRPLAAFFPGYSVVLRVAHVVTFGLIGYLPLACLVSWACFVGAAILMYQLLARHFGSRVALVATTLFCWIPGSVFFLAPYSEAMFALAVVAVATFVDRRRFWPAACVAGLASATSPDSAALTAAIVVVAWMAHRGWLRTVAYAAVSGVGLVSLMIWQWAIYGTPLQWQKSEWYWRRSFSFPFVYLYRNLTAIHDLLVGPGPAPNSTRPTFANLKWVWVLDDAMIVAATVVVVYMLAVIYASYRRGSSGSHRKTNAGIQLPLEWLVMAVVMWLIMACSAIYPYGTHYASTEGEARWVIVMFPLFAAVALMVRRLPGMAMALVMASAAAALLYQGLFNFGYWMT
jgi:hypothetical protein